MTISMVWGPGIDAMPASDWLKAHPIGWSVYWNWTCRPGHVAMRPYEQLKHIAVHALLFLPAGEHTSEWCSTGFR